MAKRMVSSGKTFSSIDEWKEEFIPTVLDRKKLEEISENPKAMGIAMANEILQNAKSKLYK